jgi:hypothetical protein
MTAWAPAVRMATLALARHADADPTAFEPLTSWAAAAGAAPGGGLRVEWVAAREPGRFGMTVFEPSSGRAHLDVGRALCAARFDAAASTAWAQSVEDLTTVGVKSHVGLAWDRQHGYRLKLFIGHGPGLGEAARRLGLAPTPELVGVGCDFWSGGRYRPRRYLRARDFSALAALAAPEQAPDWPLPERGHAVLTLTEADDALGHKTTFSAIFPPQAGLGVLAAYPAAPPRASLESLAVDLEPCVLRPSALELDRYRDGREETELLVTLGAPLSGSGELR